MNELQNRKVQDVRKPIPGCMGRMINIFDLSVGMTGTKMLTDRAHRDGSVCGNQPYMLKASDPIPVQMEDKPVTYELKKGSSNKRSGGTPMKMLIAQEMSKETESKRKPPSVVAKLMGFDGLPIQQSVPTPQGIIADPYKHSAYQHDERLSQLSGRTLCYGEDENGHFDSMTQHDVHPSQLHFSDRRQYKDVYEVWPQQSRMNHFRDQPLSKGRHNENLNDKRMALVRQKFMEAKRLATDQQLLQSKEFQEALEVLSSNKDLFLKFLEEPNSLFSKHLQEPYTPNTAPQTKRITVLKPSKYDAAYGDDMKKHYPTVNDDIFDKNKRISQSPAFVHPKDENLSQPTRIVVLKPSPRKPQDLKAAINSSKFCTGLLDNRDIFEELGSDGASESREVAKEITRQMRESLSGNRRDDTLLSSVLSNGYVGDESSFNKSDNEFMEDDGGNFSDSDIATPTSRHSWDNVHRFDSPFSLSSLSRASYSPESSVIREAKKRLSERWAMVASNGTVQQQKHVRRSSSTLGEMLAIPETKKETDNEGERNRPSGGPQDAGSPAPCSAVKGSEDGSGGTCSPRNLLRSKSLPATSLAYEGIMLNVEPSTSEIEKSIASKDPTKPKSGKSSLKGKVSSLFFSKNKKPNREKSEPSLLVSTLEGVQVANLKSMDKNLDNLSQCFSTKMQGDWQRSEELICESSSLETFENGAIHDSSSVKAASSLAKVRAAANASENQEQPSPVSVLEVSFDDDGNSSSSRSSESANLECRQLISRSPPIGSVARSLSWDDAHSDPSTLKLSRIFSKADEEEECYSFVKSLLSSSDLAVGKSSTVFAGWHSLESPLDPLLLDKFLERKEEDAKCRKRRSNQRLLFDSVNAALLDISRAVILDASQVKFIRSGVTCSGSPADACSMTDEVWGRIKTWLHSQDQSASEGENSSLVVDKALRNEVTGSGWAELISLEVNEIVNEVQGKLLEELLREALG